MEKGVKTPRDGFSLSWAELRKERINYLLADVRTPAEFAYGKITGAINLTGEELVERARGEYADKKIAVYCKDGGESAAVTEKIREGGGEAWFIEGGYEGFLASRYEIEGKAVAEKCEKSLEKKFHRALFSKFAKAVVTYDLVKPNDKIAVCISGGKDSMLMAALFRELKKHNKFPFELVFMVMDPGYSEKNLEVIKTNAKLLELPITVFNSDIFENVFEIEKSPCYICARMRRGNLYARAKELGCNKIALGHHYDDVIETVLMGMLYGGQIQTMMPKVKSANFEGMELIRPMYLIREADIIKWRDYNELYFLQCACKFTEKTADDASGSKRKKVKQLIAELSAEDPEITYNIFKSVENVNLKTIIAYKDKKGVRHGFLEDYDTN